MILFFDTETTGKYDFKANWDAPQQPHLVQLAASLESGGRVMGSINFIIRPVDWHISPEVAKIHGITENIAETSGVSRRVALAAFNQLCLLASSLSAHNLNFDYNVMLGNYAREAQEHRMTPLARHCTMMASTPLLKLPKPFRSKDPNDKYKWPTLTELHEFLFKEKFEGTHDAMNDVRALSRCYWELRRLGAL